MNNRRKFLLQSGMAATAIMITKPYQSLAEATSSITGVSADNDSILFLHTGYQYTSSHINEIKRQHHNVLLINAGKTTNGQLNAPKFDVSANQPDNILASADYKVIYKGNSKIGIIQAAPGCSVDDINAIASFLKKEKRCNLVVCLSRLGYKNKNGKDDLALAAASVHIDVIIGAHQDNYTKNPVIALNANKGEVIINHAAAHTMDIGSITIGFNKKGLKNNIDFPNRPKVPFTAQSNA